MVRKHFKIKEMKAGGLSRWRQYAEWVVGKADFISVLKYELITFFLGNLSGALGLYLRSKFYPLLFESIGSNVLFGKGITLRHPHKIRIGDNVMIDDYCMLDAKGQKNKGIVIGDGVYIGRGSILYCKDGEIEVQNNASISYNCNLFSSRYLCIGKGSMIAAYCYLMSGGSYDYQHSEVSFSDQDSYAKGPTVIGEGCWLGAKVVVLDGVSIGDRAVVGAGSVVTKSLPSRVVAVGVPAKVSDAVAKAD